MVEYRPVRLPLALILAATAALGACASAPERQWMKAGPCTTDEFTRDTEACARDGDLDAARMHARGWIQVRAVDRGETNKKPEHPPAYQVAPAAPGR